MEMESDCFPSKFVILTEYKQFEPSRQHFVSSCSFDQLEQKLVFFFLHRVRLEQIDKRISRMNHDRYKFLLYLNRFKKKKQNNKSADE